MSVNTASIVKTNRYELPCVLPKPYINIITAFATNHHLNRKGSYYSHPLVLTCYLLSLQLLWILIKNYF